MKTAYITLNLLEQKFDATEPYAVLHTNVIQVRLANSKWAYLSVTTDEATKKLLAVAISGNPNANLILQTLAQLQGKMPKDTNPIIHSDQG
ncbi:DDE-type integrase/transposase/recombinase [Ligilactobacillus agilis]|uniref:DDE-type integrase/transposase/recombinase n=1 Tax=Ligilactobacillus agilis TaxID=1601 RepID=UPI003AB4DD6C